MSRKLWSAQEELILEKLFSKGCKYAEIAEILNRSFNSVKNKLSAKHLVHQPTTGHINYDLLKIMLDDNELREIEGVSHEVA